ncbi:PREDICTED: dual specificity protein phosphatase 15 [Myotis davidii]|uniref:dual specificity protein phosphatase 15 n=1 Tax=Myotis davidii TaxID=225400 RepID=UPI000766EDA7|nr:PREDICTED: dual specificity protein phosphatase 15 [Myotis davidii]
MGSENTETGSPRTLASNYILLPVSFYSAGPVHLPLPSPLAFVPSLRFPPTLTQGSLPCAPWCLPNPSHRVQAPRGTGPLCPEVQTAFLGWRAAAASSCRGGKGRLPFPADPAGSPCLSLLQVLPGLYLGNFIDAKDPDQLGRNKITHIISIHESPQPLIQGITYLRIPVADNPEVPIKKHFKECINFIHCCRLNGGNCLVHCFAGISRSTTIVTAYVMTVTGLGWREVLEAIKSTRPIANPNPGFRQQLEEFGWGTSRKLRRQLEERFGESPFRDEEEMRSLLPLCRGCRQGGPRCRPELTPSPASPMAGDPWRREEGKVPDGGRQAAGSGGPLRLRDWLVLQVESGSYPGLCWEDEGKTLFRIPWKHAAKQGYQAQQDAALFRAWAIHKGKHLEGTDKEDPSTWKTRLRCALNKSVDFREVRERSQLDISNPYRVYQIVSDSAHGPVSRAHASFEEKGVLQSQQEPLREVMESACRTDQAGSGLATEDEDREQPPRLARQGSLAPAALLLGPLADHRYQAQDPSHFWSPLPSEDFSNPDCWLHVRLFYGAELVLEIG